MILFDYKGTSYLCITYPYTFIFALSKFLQEHWRNDPRFIHVPIETEPTPVATMTHWVFNYEFTVTAYFEGYKRTYSPTGLPCVTKLRINTGKCELTLMITQKKIYMELRAQHAYVCYNRTLKNAKVPQAHSWFDPDFMYNKDATVHSKFPSRVHRWGCYAGIHFVPTLQEARDFDFMGAL